MNTVTKESIEKKIVKKEYTVLEDGKTTLYGEAYRIKDGHQWQICKDGESLSL